jgi:hypothetical protein
MEIDLKKYELVNTIIYPEFIIDEIKKLSSSQVRAFF